MGEVSDVLAKNIAQEVSRHPGVKLVFAGGLDSEKRHIRVTLEDSKYKDDVELIIRKLSNKIHVNRRGGTSDNS